MRRLLAFQNHYPLIGPTFWILSVQYFITQWLVAQAWQPPYSWRFKTISDLGNTVCGMYADRFVCSPYAAWMNASFIVLGAAMIAGAGLIYQEFRQTRLSAVGFSAMAIAGAGTIMVGLFPENQPGPWHELGASLPFVIGNIGLVILGFALPLGRKIKWYTLLSGVIALIALALFAIQLYGNLGIGGLERVLAYPQTVWLIVFGIYMTRNRYLPSKS